MADHPSAARYRAAMATFNQDDPAAFSDMLADDVEWWAIGADEPIRGKEALFRTFEEMSEVSFDLDLHDVVANDDHLVALIQTTARRGDDELAYRVAEVYHLDDDGRVTERWAFSDDTAAIMEFFG